MKTELPPIDVAKRAAARFAADSIEDGMKIGLGTGSTAAWMVRRIGERIRNDGLTVCGVPTSEATATLARESGVPVISLDEAGRLDLTIDGADEFDPNFNLVKGGGGALLREKIVARASDQMVVIADGSKQVERLGKFPLPVEILSFGHQVTKALVEKTLAGFGMPGCTTKLRMADGAPFVTDGGNNVLDLQLNRIEDPDWLNRELNTLPGVMENGLFVGMCDMVVIGGSDGQVDVRDAPRDPERNGRSGFEHGGNLFANL